jgi:hypothetical protein
MVRKRVSTVTWMLLVSRSCSRRLTSSRWFSGVWVTTSWPESSLREPIEPPLSFHVSVATVSVTSLVMSWTSSSRVFCGCWFCWFCWLPKRPPPPPPPPRPPPPPPPPRPPPPPPPPRPPPPPPLAEFCARSKLGASVKSGMLMIRSRMS